MKLFFSLIFFFIFQFVSAQVFETSVSNNFITNDLDLFRTSDNGHIVIGDSPTQFIKFDSTGSIVWTKKYSTSYQRAALLGAGQFLVYDVRDSFGWQSAQYGELSVYDSSGYLISAVTIPESLEVKIIHPTNEMGTIAIGVDHSGTYSIQIIKTDSSGNLEWIKQLDSLGNVNRIGLGDYIQTHNGGYLASASYQYPDTLFAPYYTTVINYNSLFDTIWTRTYTAFAHQRVIATQDNGYLFFGSGSTPWLVKLDSSGFLEWTTSIPDTLNYRLKDLIQLPDGNYMIVGTEWSVDRSKFLLKIDSMGTPMWMKKYPLIYEGSNPSNCIATASDGGFIFGFSSGNFDFITIIKTDSAGNSTCDSSALIPPTFNPIIQSALPHKYFGWSDLPLSWYNSTQYPDLLDSSYMQFDYCIQTGTYLPHSLHDQLEIYPNPAMNQFTVDPPKDGSAWADSKQMANSKIEIFNPLGEKIYSAPYRESLSVDCQLFSKGIYFVRLSNSENYFVQKLIIK